MKPKPGTSSTSQSGDNPSQDSIGDVTRSTLRLGRNRLKRWGPLLIAIGIAVLLVNSRMFSLLPSIIWLAVLVGVSFTLWMVNSLPWWMRLVGVAIIYVFAITTTGDMAGVAAIGFPALAFLALHFANVRRWWPVIPGGILASVAALAGFSELFPRWDGAPILFLGFAATFTYLYLLPKLRGGQGWALYPAIVFSVLTLVINDPRGNGFGWILPFVLIGSGMWILWWWRKR